jgi:hypothetical protein
VHNPGFGVALPDLCTRPFCAIKLLRMKLSSILFLVFLLVPLVGISQRNLGEQIYNERKDEFAKSYQKKTIDSLLQRGSLTLRELKQGLGLVIEHPDSSYFVNIPKRERGDSKKWYFRYQVRRNLDFNGEQLVLGVITKGFYFDFHLLIRNDTILGVRALNGGKIYYEKIFQDKFNSYQKEHERFYGVNLKSYGEDFSPFNFHYYGTCMGLHQSLLKYCDLMVRYYKNGNKRKLIKWLKSMNPELQAYAVQGLYYLEKHKGARLTEEEQRIILHIKKRTSSVHVNPMVPAQEILNEEYFDQAYASLQERGYLKK